MEKRETSALTFIGNSGNFKMNGSLESVEKIVRSINDANLDGTNEVVIAPPALYLLKVQSELNAPTQVSAQNAFTESSGAFTGEIAPQQLKDANVHWVILGHSERRSLFGDTDKLVADKVSREKCRADIYARPPPCANTLTPLQTKAAINAGLSVIACIGESLEERESDKTMTVVERQLEAIAAAIDVDAWKRIVIACTSFSFSFSFISIPTLTPPLLQTNPSGLLAPAKSPPSPKRKKSTLPSAPGSLAALPPRLPTRPVSFTAVPSMARTVAS